MYYSHGERHLEVNILNEYSNSYCRHLSCLNFIYIYCEPLGERNRELNKKQLSEGL